MITTDITKAVKILQDGGLVAMPTETVYGLGADATNENAIKHIFRVKERPYDHPLIVHLASLDQVAEWAREFTPMAEQLAKAFWPGPLTLILKKQPQVLDVVTGGQDTIGLRIPSHPVALALLRAFGGGIAAPSANKFTHISPTTALAVEEELGDRIDLIIDGGDCTVGLESTIIDVTGDQPVILRPGMITAEAIAQVLQSSVTSSYESHQAATRVPGMHHLHYAPTTLTYVMSSDEIPDFLQTAKKPLALLTHTNIALPESDQIHRLQLLNEPNAYAHDLYRSLRELDKQHYQCIIVEAVPSMPEWDAIRDRLNKASARNLINK